MPIMLIVGLFGTLYNLLNRFTPKTRILKFHGAQKNRHGQLFSKTSSTGINQRPESTQCKLKRGFNFDLVPIQTILRNFDDLLKLVFTCLRNISLIVTHWFHVHYCITTTQCSCCIALNFILACLEGYKASPYPEVDGFLIEHSRKLNPSAGIRHWTYFSQGEVIVYEMVNYRYCHNVQRSHKSNNVM